MLSILKKLKNSILEFFKEEPKPIVFSITNEQLLKEGFDQKDIEDIKNKDFSSIATLKYKLKESDNLKITVREVLNQRYGRIFITKFQYTKKRVYDDYDYDYEYINGKLYLNEQNEWEEIIDDISHSETFDGD